MFLFYVLSFFKKGDIIEGGKLFKEIRYASFFSAYTTNVYTLICLSMYLDYYLLFCYIFITFESEKA